jgi:hypothetical protein
MKAWSSTSESECLDPDAIATTMDAIHSERFQAAGAWVEMAAWRHVLQRAANPNLEARTGAA